jgi:hypothetical protein
MTTLDIRDFGAAVDGTTDDTEAVRSAVDAAARGDSVFFPEGVTLVGDGYKRSIWLESSHSGITLRGVGESSVIKQAGGHTRNNQVIYIKGDTDPTDITVRDLRVDGNRTNNDDRTTQGVMVWPPGNTENILFENVWVENCSATGYRISSGGVRLNYCTARYNSMHGFNPTASSPAIRIEVTNVLSHHNDLYGIDDSCGDSYIDGFVVHDCVYGMKNTLETEQTEIKNGRITDCDTIGYSTNIPNDKWPSSRPQVSLDNVLAEGNARWGFRLDENADYTIGMIIARSNNTAGKVAQIGVRSDCSVDAAEIRSYDAASGAGLFFDTDQNAVIDSYYHAGNPDGDTVMGNSNGNLTVENELTDRLSNDSIPTREQVGAGQLTEANLSMNTTSGVIQTAGGVIQTR